MRVRCVCVLAWNRTASLNFEETAQQICVHLSSRSNSRNRLHLVHFNPLGFLVCFASVAQSILLFCVSLATAHLLLLTAHPSPLLSPHRLLDKGCEWRAQSPHVYLLDVLSNLAVQGYLERADQETLDALVLGADEELLQAFNQYASRYVQHLCACCSFFV